MKYRYMTIADIPDVIRLYQQHLTENPRFYPSPGPTPDVNLHQYLEWSLTKNRERWFAVVADPAIPDRRLRGAILCVLNPRLMEYPQMVGYIEFLGVDTHLRRKGIARKLLQVGSRLLYEKGAGVLECAWAPGSTSGELWQAMGVRPYNVIGGWVDQQGQPRTDLPLIPSGVTLPASPVPTLAGVAEGAELDGDAIADE